METPAVFSCDELLEAGVLTKLANEVTETLAPSKPLDVDKLIMLQKQAETLASLQKEYYVIHRRFKRIGSLATALSKKSHNGRPGGVIDKLVGQAGG
jgi:hypothetical protein